MMKGLVTSDFCRVFHKRLGEFRDELLEISHHPVPPSDSRDEGNLPIDEILRSMIRAEIKLEKFNAIRNAGRANPALYVKLREIYQDVCHRPLEIDGVRFTLLPVEPYAALKVVPLGPLRFELSQAFGRSGPREEIRDGSLLKHPSPYDLQSRKVPPEIIQLYGGDPRGGRVFVLKGLESEGGYLSAAVATATYGQVVDTSDSLTMEAYLLAGLMTQAELEKATPSEVLECLPWRRQLHDKEGSLASVLLQPKHRAAGLGISCLTAYQVDNHPRSVQLLRAKRGNKVAVLTDIYHVVPAGMCACHDEKSILHEDDVMLTLYKEFMEELFNDKTAEYMKGRENIKAYVNDKIAGLLFPGAAGGELVTIEQTGLAIDLTNLRPELTAINLIENPDVQTHLETKRHPNYENVSVTPHNVDLKPGALTAAEWVQTGAAAWDLGLGWLRDNYF